MGHGSAVHGSMSRMPTILPVSSQNAIESGISVSFIQKLPLVAAIEEEHHALVRARDVRSINPCSRSLSVSAASTVSRVVPVVGLDHR